MIIYILLLWVLIKLSAPVWCYILYGVGVCAKAVIALAKLISN